MPFDGRLAGSAGQESRGGGNSVRAGSVLPAAWDLARILAAGCGAAVGIYLMLGAVLGWPAPALLLWLAGVGS